ncbi:hypothetical protein RhiirC2_234307 [Rhizophagus irregularis]|uniref:Uncharacterized protein n=1 Tax=Rhizophagus irregularis TaxID=588596 RepID=A0A2N1NNG8_9GLOM|nr:hypothetical protein RhiirC2_234307 [Rhizophagus irregularis]
MLVMKYYYIRNVLTYIVANMPIISWLNFRYVFMETINSLEIMLQYILNFVSNLLKLNSFGTNLSFSTYIKKICIILQAMLTL